MAQKVFMIFLILVILLGGGFYAYKELMPPAEEVALGDVYATKEVVRGDISVGVEVVGSLNPSNSGGIRVPGNRYDSSLTYTIEEFLVEEGDEVTKGQPLVNLNSSKLLDEIELKREDYETKREALAEKSQMPVEEVEKLNPTRGLTLVSPIGGMVTELDITDGEEITAGKTIARIVDNSKYIVKAKLKELEYQKVKEGQEVILSFPYFDEQYKGVITKINHNPIFDMPESGDSDEFAKGFVYIATIEAENMGLVQRNMEVQVGVRNENDSIHNFSNSAVVDSFIKEEKVVNTIDAVITKIHVDEMATVEKGEPLVTMAGTDIQDELEDDVEEIRDLKLELMELESNLSDLIVTAPMNGIVATFHSEVGDEVGSRDWLGSLYTVDDMQMWSQVDDIDVVYVKQGAPVKVTVDAVQGQTFNGEVTSVETMGSQVNGISKFGVVIKVEGGAEIRPGMQGRAFIDGGNAENVLLVPIEAIFEEEGKSMVEILNADGTTKVVPVQLGLMNDRIAEVESGVEEGQLVITGSSADLLPSQHITNEGGLLPEKQNGNGEDK